jgi:hypothetical protein
MKVENDLLSTLGTEPMRFAPGLEDKRVWLKVCRLCKVEVIGFCAWVHPLFLRKVDASELKAESTEHGIFEEDLWTRTRPDWRCEEPCQSNKH